MKELEKMTMQLANKCRENKLNFMIVIEDAKGIHSNHSISGKSPLRKLTEALKSIKN